MVLLRWMHRETDGLSGIGAAGNGWALCKMDPLEDSLSGRQTLWQIGSLDDGLSGTRRLP